jgi:light-regulated signal transduction histidine kinase (bacteriophytochrome)
MFLLVSIYKYPAKGWDNGIGFNQEDADPIFNVFTCLHGLFEYKGLGIGLSIVRKVIENHNGYI